MSLRKYKICVNVMFILAFALCGVTVTNVFAQQNGAIPIQDAPIVTFYSNGFTLTGGFGNNTHEGFRGNVYADHVLLGHLGTANYFSFTFTPGNHDFAADSWASHRDTHGAHLSLTLHNGDHYFIELSTKQKLFSGALFGIEVFPCEKARLLNRTDKSADPKNLTADGTKHYIPETSFPSCPIVSESK